MPEDVGTAKPGKMGDVWMESRAAVRVTEGGGCKVVVFPLRARQQTEKFAAVRDGHFIHFYRWFNASGSVAVSLAECYNAGFGT